MRKELADLVDAAIPLAFGLMMLAWPRSLTKRDLAEHERTALLRKIRLLGGALITIGAFTLALEWLR
jgi:hypothetical protein